eukprot:Ihof_evm11s82 gene=Ihof_evmTU11s82
MIATVPTFLLMVKRQKTTIFFEVTKNETIGSLRKQIEAILKNSIDNIALVRVNDDTKILGDDMTLEALNIVADGVLGLILKT